MNEIEYRAVIKFFCKDGRNAIYIFNYISKVYGESAPSYATVTRWVKLFKSGRESLEDDNRSGRPADAISHENVILAESIVLEDRRISVPRLAWRLSLSYGTTYTILHDHLHMSKVSARWVPRLLNAEQKKMRVQTSKAILDMYKEDPENFLDNIITGDETWLHHWDPESKQESMQWIKRGEPPPKKFKTQPSAGKVLATIFWDAEGILMIDYMPPKTTITGIYYAEVLRKLKKAIREKRPRKVRKKILLLHDNAPVHKANVAQAALKDCGFVEIPHPPYSPDLAPSDYFLFPNLKKTLRGRKFSSDYEVQSVVNDYFMEQKKSFF